ncbi:MAG: hypothetical protein WCF20_11135 [Methylovirgula sp.]
MRNKSLGRAADFQLDKMQDYSCRNTAGCDEAPRPSEVLCEIGVAIAAFLGIAVLAQLLVLAIQAG